MPRSILKSLFITLAFKLLIPPKWIVPVGCKAANIPFTPPAFYPPFTTFFLTDAIKTNLLFSNYLDLFLHNSSTTCCLPYFVLRPHCNATYFVTAISSWVASVMSPLVVKFFLLVETIFFYKLKHLQPNSYPHHWKVCCCRSGIHRLSSV